MASRYVDHVAHTPQTEQADPRQVPNSGGGYAFTIDKWARLDRWLIIGSASTYYASARKLTRENATALRACLAEDGPRTVARIVAISQEGRAPKNDSAIFALALAACEPDASPLTKAVALEMMPAVCRTGTHLFQFVDAVNKLRGWGRGLKRGVARWYTGKDVKDLAYQVLKYQSRDGWSHRDVIRLAHPKPSDDAQALYRWVVKAGLGARDVKRMDKRPERLGEARVVTYPMPADAAFPALLSAYDELLSETTLLPRVVALIREHRMTHEMVPSAWKHSAEVWDALSEHMPLGALLRNLANLTARGTIAPLSAKTVAIAGRLADKAAIKKARLHPIAILMALRTYAAGHGDKGKLTWTAIPSIIEALNEAFYLSFGTLEPTGKATLLALDVSGSMGGTFGSLWGHRSAQGPLTPREISAAMAMAIARVEPNWHIMGFADSFRPLPITPAQRLDEVVRAISDIPFGNTDCALPFTWAQQNKVRFDVACVLTDNETNRSSEHPHVALGKYRKTVNPAAKLAVAAVTATDFSIAQPGDPGMLDIVGYDGSVPAVLADFARG